MGRCALVPPADQLLFFGGVSHTFFSILLFSVISNPANPLSLERAAVPPTMSLVPSCAGEFLERGLVFLVTRSFFRSGLLVDPRLSPRLPTPLCFHCR